MSRKTACSSVLLVLICWAALVVTASAQQFQQVKGTLVSISAGRNEAFGFDIKGAVWRFHPTTNSFGKVAHATLVNIAVGGGTAAQLDEVWGINASGDVYRFNYTTKAFAQVPANLSQIAVGPGYQDDCHPYEVWGINSADAIFRFNFCSGLFDSIGGLLTQIATGGGDMWGLNNGAKFFTITLLPRRS